MWQINIGNTDFFHIFFMFIIYSFAGWLMETILVSTQSKEFINRGFMNGPFCPIYGTGALAVYFFLTPIKSNIILVIIFGGIVATIIEYITSAVMEKIFNAKWWDYSDKKFNLNGRICLSISICWGFLSAFMLYVLQPILFNFIGKIPKLAGEIIGTVIIGYFACDITITVFNILSINSKLEAISRIREEFHERLEELVLFSSRKDFYEKIKLHNFKNSEYLNEFKISLEKEIEKYYNEKHELYNEKRENLESTINELKTRLEKRAEYFKRVNPIEKRIFKAFPNIKSTKFSDDMAEIKEYLKEISKRRRL